MVTEGRIPAEVTGAYLELVDVVADTHLDRVGRRQLGYDALPEAERSNALVPPAPEGAPREVVDSVSPCGALPGKDRGDGVRRRRDENVVVEQVGVDELAALGARVEQRADAAVDRSERAVGLRGR